MPHPSELGPRGASQPGGAIAKRQAAGSRAHEFCPCVLESSAMRPAAAAAARPSSAPLPPPLVVVVPPITDGAGRRRPPAGRPACCQCHVDVLLRCPLTSLDLAAATTRVLIIALPRCRWLRDRLSIRDVRTATQQRNNNGKIVGGIGEEFNPSSRLRLPLFRRRITR